MTEKDKERLILFTIRTRMFVPCPDREGIVAFLIGYELGRNDKCDFTTKMGQYIINNLKIAYGSDGWCGGLERYAYKKSISWVTAFKQVAIEVIASGENESKARMYLRQRIESLLNRIQESGDYWFDRSWIAEWVSFCSSKNTWFRKIWTEKEYEVIQSVGKLIEGNQVFEDWKPFRPTQTLLDLKKQFYGNKP